MLVQLQIVPKLEQPLKRHGFLSIFNLIYFYLFNLNVKDLGRWIAIFFTLYELIKHTEPTESLYGLNCTNSSGEIYKAHNYNPFTPVDTVTAVLFYRFTPAEYKNMLNKY